MHYLLEVYGLLHFINLIIFIPSVYTGLIVINVGKLVSESVSQSTNYTYIDRGNMLRDNALKFYRDQVYDIPQKPIENGQYINKNGLLAAILKIRKILLRSIEATCFEIML